MVKHSRDDIGCWGCAKVTAPPTVCGSGTSAACPSGQKIEWTAGNQPSKIPVAGGDLAFVDGPERQRVRQVEKLAGGQIRATHYVTPAFEVVHDSQEGTAYTTHVYFGDRLVFLQRDAEGATHGYYVHVDMQGSIDRLTDAGGIRHNRASLSRRRNRRPGDATPAGEGLPRLNRYRAATFSGLLTVIVIQPSASMSDTSTSMPMISACSSISGRV